MQSTSTTLVPDHLTISTSHPCALMKSPAILLLADTGEPYMPIPGSDSLILTPARASDVPARVDLLNDPSVDPWMWSPPKPYTTSDALERFTCVRAVEQALFDDWARTGRPSGLPLSCIRRRVAQSDGTTEDVLLGEVGFHREDDFVEIADKVERQAAVERNLRREAGDGEIMWTWFFNLSPIAAGKGVMTRVLQHLLYTFLVPVLNVRHIISFAFVGNEGSRRVHLKLGFEEAGTDWIRMPEYRGGQMREEWIFKWATSDEKGQ